MTRGTVNKLILLGNFITLAIIIGFGVWLAHRPAIAPVNHCPPSDAANPWCSR